MDVDVDVVSYSWILMTFLSQRWDGFLLLTSMCLT